MYQTRSGSVVVGTHRADCLVFWPWLAKTALDTTFMPSALRALRTHLHQYRRLRTVPCFKEPMQWSLGMVHHNQRVADGMDELHRIPASVAIVGDTGEPMRREGSLHRNTIRLQKVLE